MKPLNLAWLSRWERPAYLVDLYRVFPRGILLGYSFMVVEVARWFMALDKPSPEQSAFATLIGGFLVPLTNWYMQNGVDWEKRRSPNNATTTTTIVATEEQTK